MVASWFTKQFRPWAIAARRARQTAPRRLGKRRPLPHFEPLEARIALAADPIVTVNTNLGSFQIELLQTTAPLAVANFLHYVNANSYTDTIFHRSVPGFIVQAGGYTTHSPTFTNNSQFTAIAAAGPVTNEFLLSNLRGTVAMAKLGNDPNSATDEWFVNLADNSSNLDKQNGGFTVFGQVLGNGMQVVDQIAALPIPTGNASPFDQLPVGPGNQLAEITSIKTVTTTTNTTGAIQGQVFNDVNANGALDAGDTPIAGATVFIDANKNGILDSSEVSTTTDSAGGYTLTGLAPGNYAIRQSVTPDHGVAITTPSGGAATITVTAGATAVGPNFGDLQVSQVVPLPVANTPIPASGDGNTKFVEALYVNLLGHLADLAGLAHATSQLVQGASRATVAKSIWDSAEHRGLEVDRFYATYLRRAAEPVGRGYWIGRLNTDISEQVAAAGIAGSAEYQRINGSGASVVNALFTDFLFRAPETAGAAHWQNFLKTKSPWLMAQSLVNTAEPAGRIVDAFFSAFLHRAPDAAARKSFVTELEQGTPAETVAVNILATDEFFAKAAAH